MNYAQGEVDSRMMTALLTGVNRAYPYAKEEMEKMLEYIDTMYKVVHYASFNVSLHTLSLLFQVSDFANSVSDRYYISSFIIWYFTKQLIFCLAF